MRVSYRCCARIDWSATRVNKASHARVWFSFQCESLLPGGHLQVPFFSGSIVRPSIVVENFCESERRASWSTPTRRRIRSTSVARAREDHYIVVVDFYRRSCACIFPILILSLSLSLPFSFSISVIIVSVARSPLISISRSFSVSLSLALFVSLFFSSLFFFLSLFSSFPSLLYTSIGYSTIAYPRQAKKERERTPLAYWIETTHFRRSERRRNFLWQWNFALFSGGYRTHARIQTRTCIKIYAYIELYWILRRVTAQVIRHKTMTSPLCRAD